MTQSSLRAAFLAIVASNDSAYKGPPWPNPEPFGEFTPGLRREIRAGAAGAKDMERCEIAATFL